LLEGFHIEPLLNRRTIIVGEAGSGKSRLTSMLLREALQRAGQKDITVLDFAPRKMRRHGLAIGGWLSDYGPLDAGYTYYRSEAIRAPRMEGRNRQAIEDLAEHNALLTTGFIRKFLSSPTPYLFINDLTIHLQAGNVQLLIGAIQKSSTFIGNAYRGSVLARDRGSGISDREGELLKAVISMMDILIDLSP